MAMPDRCKLLTENDIKAIIEIRQHFDEPIILLRQHLAAMSSVMMSIWMSQMPIVPTALIDLLCLLTVKLILKKMKK